MRGTLTERAFEALGDYLFELETGDKRRGNSYGQSRSVAEEPAPESENPMSQMDVAAQHAALEWENEQLRLWRKSGRLTADGVLRVGSDPLNPYTLRDLVRVMPQLNVYDRVAALVDLNGVVKRGYMESKEHENIREVVEQIADRRVAIRLQDGDTAMLLKDLIRAEVSEIFGEVLTRFKSPASTLKVGGRQQKCSKCQQPGHRAPTCGKKDVAIDIPKTDGMEPLTPAEDIPS